MRAVRRFRTVGFVGAAFVVVVTSACGGGSGRSATKPTRSRSSTASTATTATKAPQGGVNPNAPEAPIVGDIPDNQVFVPVGGAGYTIKVPEGWARSDNGAVVVFTDRYNTIRIETGASPVAPSVASVGGAEVTQLRASSPGFALGNVTTVSRSAGPAVLVVYQADSVADPVTGKKVRLDVERYEFWRNGKTVAVTLSAPKGSDNVDPWKLVTNSFAWQA